ncbi:S8 family peptidase [Nocardioides litoris]|uniref:S8 family peptidase n=1 Tax=Nocardioides litoris TaxID=1926648 RepID=UPI001FE2BC9B|nr:S8 family peptidase [Nocardioides litoris]
MLKSLATAAALASALVALPGSPAGAAPDAGPTATAGRAAPAPLVTAADPIASRYIVMLAGGAADARTEAQQAVEGEGGRVTEVYTELDGYAAVLTPEQLAEVRNDPATSFVQQDGVMSINATQTNPTYGLDRIDQRNRPLSGTYTYTRTGAGVRSYVIDTGINASHQEFSGRVASGYTAINDGRGTTDCNGHGTHVAGTVGGTRYGVAKGTTLVPVRVLGCNGSGSNSGVIAGMDWVASTASRPAVANMSLGGGADSATDAAVARMTNAGVTVVVAAGNENQNACNASPARAASAITVASSTSSDARSSFSNYGSCVDIFAPGSSITSAWIGSSTATNTISGTSMASPHVAGVAALYLQGNPSASPSTVTNALLGNATTNVVSGANGSPNRLLFTSS